MKCDLCKIRDAEVHINTISNGIKTELHLCRSCVKNIEIVDKTSNTSKEYKCLSCNTTYEEFKKTGKFGCINCYKTFGKDISGILIQICENTMRVGKYPIKKSGYLKTKEEVENIREKLKIAILEEEYELAAKLRDTIRSIEKN